MTDENTIYTLESPVFLKLDSKVVHSLPKWHFIRELSETNLHIATRVRVPPQWHRNQAKYYKLFGSDTFYHERYFRIVLDQCVN